MPCDVGFLWRVNFLRKSAQIKTSRRIIPADDDPVFHPKHAPEYEPHHQNQPYPKPGPVDSSHSFEFRRSKNQKLWKSAADAFLPYNPADHLVMVLLNAQTWLSIY